MSAKQSSNNSAAVHSSKERHANPLFWKMVDAVWRFFVSVRLAISLLIFIGLGSIVGTMFPQMPQQPGLTLVHLESAYSPGWFAVLSFFQVFDLYHSWWYALLLDLLALNLVACTLPKIAPLMRLMAKRTKEPMGVAGIRKIKALWPNPPPDSGSLEKVVGCKLHAPKTASGWWWMERGRLGRTGFLLVHVGMAVILVAGGLGQMASVEGSMILSEGQKSANMEVRLPEGRTEVHTLPFTLHCRKFRIGQFAAGPGGVREYVSLLEVIEQGRVVQEKEIKVNQPLSFGGYSFYQSSYQNLRERDEATLKIKDVAGERTINARVGQEVARGTDGTVYRLHGYREEFGGLGRAVRIESTLQNGERRSFWVFAKYPGFVGRNRSGSVELDVLEYKLGYATILGVSKDPSTAVLWVGSSLLLIGLLVAFVTRHRRLWLQRTADGLELFCWAQRGVDNWKEEIIKRIKSHSLEVIEEET